MKSVTRLLAGLLSLGVSGVFLIDCASEASCETVCENGVELCLGESNEAAENNCRESCEQQKSVIPASCDEQVTAVLECLTDAETVDCNNLLASSACQAELSAAYACAAGDESAEDSPN